MEPIVKPGWHHRGYLPHFDATCALQHLVLSPEGCSRFDAPELAALIEDTLRLRDGERYDLQAWCVMPDHVHVCCAFAPDVLQGRTVRNWKSWITRHWNARSGVTGRLFSLDYFDRHARTLDQADRTVAYIERNPVAAGLVAMAPDWRWSSAWHKARGWRPGRNWAPVFLPSGSR
jgi:REP element-mobilizing transposase RayT